MIVERATKTLTLVLLTGTTSVINGIACVDTAAGTGQALPATTSTTLLPIGRFLDAVVGDGTKTVRVQLFREVYLHRFTGGGVLAPVAGDLGRDCYLVDQTTVSMTATGRSVAGRVWLVSGTDVYVEMAAPDR